MSANDGLAAAALRLEAWRRAFGELSSRDQHGPAVRRLPARGMRAR